MILDRILCEKVEKLAYDILAFENLETLIKKMPRCSRNALQVSTVLQQNQNLHRLKSRNRSLPCWHMGRLQLEQVLPVTLPMAYSAPFTNMGQFKAIKVVAVTGVWNIPIDSFLAGFRIVLTHVRLKQYRVQLTCKQRWPRLLFQLQTNAMFLVS